jgi:hypothetical protein
MNYSLFRVKDSDLERIVMAMYQLSEFEESVRKEEVRQLSIKNPAVGNIVGDASTFDFLQVLLTTCEDHYRRGPFYTVKWLKANFQSWHGGVSAEFYNSDNKLN